MRGSWNFWRYETFWDQKQKVFGNKWNLGWVTETLIFKSEKYFKVQETSTQKSFVNSSKVSTRLNL